MALVNRTIVIGSHLFFAREGAEETVGGEDEVVSPAYKPLTASALYEELGAIETLDITSKTDNLRLKAPAQGGGAYKLRKLIPLSQELTLKAKVQDYNQLAFESLFLLAGPITIATPQQPLKQSKPITGWLKVEQRDHTDTLISTLFLWVALMVSTQKNAEKEYSYEVTVEVLDNALNTFNLAALVAN